MDGETADMGQDSPIVKICIAVPNEGHTLPEAYDNRMLMMLHLGLLQERSKWEPVELRGGGPERLEFYHFTAGRLLTPAAREALADNALNAGMDYLFMIDDDMICPIDLFEKKNSTGTTLRSWRRSPLPATPRITPFSTSARRDGTRSPKTTISSITTSGITRRIRWCAAMRSVSDRF
jgi:hypothetical protein